MPSEQQSVLGRAVQHHQVVIVGGGSAGISVAARLRRASQRPDVAIIEPSDTHYYQPLWTLVGGGIVSKESSARPQSGQIPPGARWIRAAATRLDPEARHVELDDGSVVEYDVLVVACGIELDWDGVKGLSGALGHDGVCSNYAYDQCERTWQTISSLQGGTALFTMPPPPIKCAGAPQKIMYLADEALRRRGVRDRTRIIYAAATPSIFAVPEYARSLERVIERKGIETLYDHNLVEVRPQTREAVFVDGAGELVTLTYDMLHVAPPQRAPALVRDSALADAGGWLEVDRATLRHPRYDNVFSLGDASGAPTSKTGAAIRKQAPVVAENVLAALRDVTPSAAYDGYTACPLVTGYGKLIMAEFDYDKRPAPTFPIDQTRERRSMYLVKRYALPTFYWRGMLRGVA